MKKYLLLALLLALAPLAFAENGNKNDLAYIGYDELETVASVGTDDSLVVFEGSVPKKGVTASALMALSTGASGAYTVTGALVSEGLLDLGTVETFVDSDTTPAVNTGSYFNTNTTSVTITDFDGTGIVAGQLLVVVSKGAITFDVTSSGIIGGTTDIITAAGDVTTFLYDGTDWYVVARMDMSDDLN